MKNEKAIIVKSLSKQYTIGKHKEKYKTLRETVSNRILSIFRQAENDKETAIWAVRDISFEVKKGEIIGVIGRNGAGKSTLLKILSRITNPTGGSIVMNGRVGSLLEVGTGFHPELTGRENVYLNAAILGMLKKEIDGKFEEIVSFAELDKFIDTPVKRYSSGMYMRLAFAVAAHLETEILLVDEVLAVGDMEFQKKCLGKMKDVSLQGRTVLFVSHNMSAVNQLCSRTILLDKGKIVYDGATDEAIDRYLTSDLKERKPVRRWNDLDKQPGNDEVKLRSIRVLNKDRGESISFKNSEPLWIELEYATLKETKPFRFVVKIIAADGSVLFVLRDNLEHQFETSSRPLGVAKSICQIPAHILKEGSYTLIVSCEIPFQKIIFLEENVLRFHVVWASGLTGEKGEKTWPGIIWPYIKWQIESSGDRT